MDFNFRVHINILENRHKCKQNCVCHIVAYGKELWEACLEAPFAMLIQGFYIGGILFSLERVIKTTGGRVKLPQPPSVHRTQVVALNAEKVHSLWPSPWSPCNLSEEAPAAAWSSGGPMG